MSLSRLALRLTTVQALRAALPPTVRVSDSEIGPVEDVAEDSNVPHVVVYTDDAKRETSGTDLMGGGSVSLVLEILVTTRMRNPDAAENEPELVDVQALSDATLERIIDVIERQCVLALTMPAPDATWADLWRSFATAIVGYASQRGASAKEGLRFAGRQITLDVSLLREPHPGAAPRAGSAWQRLLTLMAADPDLDELAPKFEALIVGDPEVLAEHLRTMQAHGLAAARADAMLLTPAHPDADGFGDVATVPAAVPHEFGDGSDLGVSGAH